MKTTIQGLGFRVDWGYIGILENRMETTIVYRGYIPITEKKMKATILYDRTV